jgi:NAD dependent epimerase/dehydratase
MKKILITGATGFVGSHLTELCVQKGYKVVAFDRYNPNYNLGWLEKSKYKDDINFIFGDIRDYDSVLKSMKGCNIVFHLAALIGIPYSYFSPLAYIKTNIEGTYNILESAKHLNLEQTIITSTSETYGTAKYVPIDEKHPLSSQSPYSASKISADQLSLSYWNSFQLPIKIIRPFNIYGPRQSIRAVIPSIIIQALNNKKTINLGNIEPTRDLTYVKDTCDAFLAIVKNKHFFGNVLNVGSNNEYSVEIIAKKILKKFNSDAKIKKEKKRIRSSKSEVDRLVCDNKKILKFTNWKPKVNFDKGLDLTIDWFKEFKDYFRHDIYHV